LSYVESMNHNEAIALMIASNFFNCHPLLDLLGSVVAEAVKACEEPKDVVKKFGLASKVFTKQEIEDYKAENNFLKQ